MQYRAVDTETVAFQEDGNGSIPPMVCLSAAGAGMPPGLWRYTDALPVFGPWLVDSQTMLVGHNLGSFDLPVIMSQYPDTIPYVFEKAAAGLFADTMIDQKILDLAFGSYRGKFEKDGSWTQHNYALTDLSSRYLHRRMLKGEDSWQKRYGELREVPVPAWPKDAQDYAIGDAVVTDQINSRHRAQREAFRVRTARPDFMGFDLLADSAAQMRAAIWLGLMQAWGIRIDVSKIHILEQAILEDYNEQLLIARMPFEDEPCPAMCFVKPIRATKGGPGRPGRPFTPGYTYQCAKVSCAEHGLVRPDGTRDQKRSKDYMVKVMREAGRLPKITKGGLEKIKAAEDLPDLITIAEASLVTQNGPKKFFIVNEKTATKLAEPVPPDAPPYVTPLIRRESLIDYLQEQFISLDKEACEDSDDDVLAAYAELTKLSSVLTKDVPRMRAGRIHASFNSLLRTGRTSCRGYNLQNPSRKGGVRECFIPDPGFVFAMIDLDGAELRGMAQVCLSLFGWSRLADALNAGKDAHLILGANLLGISYDEALRRYELGDSAVEDARQMAKVGNFGFAGGMGAKKFRIYAKQSYGLRMTLEQVQWLKAKWLETWPEFQLYFKVHGALVDFPGSAAFPDLSPDLPKDFGEMASGAWFVEQSSGRLHAGLRYSQACNLRFQGLIATAFKASGWALCRACYDPRAGSVLFGSRPVNEIHDEHILAVPEQIASECADELGRIVIGAVAPYLPGVPPTAKPYLTRCWSKKAFDVRDAAGRRIPWDGHTKDKKSGAILTKEGIALAA